MPKNPWEMDWGGGDPAPWEMEWEAPAEIASNPVRDQLLEEKKKRGLKTLGGALSPETIGGFAPETRLPGEAPDIPYRRAPEVDEAAAEGPWDRVFDLSNVPNIGTRALEGAQRWNVPSNILESGRKVLSHARVGSTPTAEDTPTARDLASVFGGAGAIPPVGEFIEEKLGPVVNPAIAGAYGLANKYGPASVIRRTIAPDADESTLEAAALLPARGLGQVFDTLATDPTNAVLMAASGGAAPVVKGAQIAAEGAFLLGMGQEIAPAAARMGEAYEERGVKGAIQEAPGVVVPAAFATMLGTKLAKHAGPEAVDYARNRRAYSAAQAKAKAATDFEAKGQERAQLEAELQPAVDAAASKEPVAVAKAQEMKTRLDQLKTELEGTPESPVIRPEPLNRWELERLERGRPKLGEKFEGGAPGTSRTAPKNEGAGMPAEEVGRILSVNPDDPIVKRTNIQVWNSVDDPGFLDAIDNPRLGMRNPRLALEERLRAGETPADISRTFNVPAFATPDGTLHIVAPRVESVSHLNELLDHETTHVALQAAAGTGEVHPVLGKAAEATLKALAARAQEETGPGGRVAEHYAGEPVRNVGEEVLAHGTEFTNTRQAPSVIDRGVAAVRDTLRARLPERFQALVGKASDPEIRVMLDRARKIIESRPSGKLQVGAKTTPGQGGGKKAPTLTDIGREVATMVSEYERQGTAFWESPEALSGVPEWAALQKARPPVEKSALRPDVDAMLAEQARNDRARIAAQREGTAAAARRAEADMAPLETDRRRRTADEANRAVGRTVIENAATEAAARQEQARSEAEFATARKAAERKRADEIRAVKEIGLGPATLNRILENQKPKTAEKAPGKVPVEPQPTTVPPAAGPETRQAPPGETPTPPAEAEYAGMERRQARERRVQETIGKPTEQLTPEDVVALHERAGENPVSGLPSETTWRATPRKAHALSMDLDGLKHLNDEYGSGAGDQMLAKFGDVTREVQARHAEVFAAHPHGDEFWAEHADRTALEAFDKDLRDTWRETPIRVVDGHGNGHELRGLEFSSGLDSTIDLADRQMKGDVDDVQLQPNSKRARTARGERSTDRGGAPTGLRARPLEESPERAGGLPEVTPRSGEDRRVRGLAKEDVGPKLSRRSEPTPDKQPSPIFYSKLRREIEGGQERWSTVDLARFLKARGVKAEEMEWAKIPEVLAGKRSITKQELLGHLEENAVRVEEKVYGNMPEIDRLADEHQKAAEEHFAATEAIRAALAERGEMGPHEPYFAGIHDKRARAAGLDELLDARDKKADAVEEAGLALRDTSDRQGGEPKFSEYQLPGGKNYRELLLTLPAEPRKLDVVQHGKRGDWYIVDPEGKPMSVGYRTRDDALARIAAVPQWQYDATYRSTHYPEIANPLAHVRFNERKGPNGERILHIEEVQSDWGQKLRGSLPLRELRKPNAVREQAEDFFGRENAAALPLDEVDGGVLALLKHKEVVRDVVALLPVDVVDKLGGSERAAEKLLGNPSVVFKSLPADTGPSVSASVLDAARSVTARIRTELLRGFQAGRDVDVLPALRASDLNAREVVGALAPDSLYHVRLPDQAVGGDVAGARAETTTGRDLAVRDAKRTPASDTEFLDTPVLARAGTETGRAGPPDLGHESGPTSIAKALDWHSKLLPVGSSRRVEYSPSDVPSMPFSRTWPDLALKRTLRWAADEGFDKVTWATGEQQAERYDLSKHISATEIKPSGDGWAVTLWGKDGNILPMGGANRIVGIAESDLPNYVGKDLAKKAVADGGGHYSGLDLKVGGEGMKGFYDQMLPAKMQDLARKLDSSLKVGTTEIQTGPPNAKPYYHVVDETGETILAAQPRDTAERWARDNEGDQFHGLRVMKTPMQETTTVHSIDLTPKAREAAKAGLPLFSRRAAPARDIPLAAPQVKARMARLGEGESRLMETDPNYRVKSLKRDAPQTWESLDKAIRDKSATWTDDQIAAAAQKSGRTFNAVEQQTVAARAQLRHAQMMERAHARVEAFDMSAAERKAKGVDLDRLIRDEFDSTLVASAMERASINAGTEVARALGARRRIMDVGPEPNPDVLIRKLIKETGAKDADVAEMYLLYKAGETRKFAEKMRDVMRPGWAQKVMEYWRGGLLSGLGTHGANFSGNTGEVAFRLAETMASAGIDKAWSTLSGRPRERFTAEARHEIAGQLDALPEAFKRLTGDLVDQVLLQHEPPADMSRKFDYQVGAIGGRTGRLVRTPFRALGIADDFFKALGGEAALRKRAYREARKEGLTGDAAETRAIRVANEARQLVDERWRRLMEEVGQEKLERVFQEDPVRIVQALSQLTHEHPLAGLVFPFVKTPANITRVAWQRSPMGLVTGKAPALVKKYRAQQKALAEGRSIPEAELVTKGQVSDALARPAVGIALTTAISALAAAGFLTGSGPVDREENKAQRATGWQPYSIRIPTGDPERPYRYVPYNRFEPAASLIGSVADLFEAHDERKVSQKVLGSLAVNWTNKTYFRSLNDIARAITDPNMSAKGVAASYASSFAVPAIVAKAAEAGDPYFRERRSASGLEGVGEAAARGIGRRLPGFSRTLEPIYTPLGEPARRPGNALTRFALPIQPSQSRPGTELEAYLVKIHAVPSEVPRELEIPKALLPRSLDRPIDSMRIELTDSERAVLAKARRDAALILRRSLPSLRSLPVDERRDRIEKTFSAANRRAISTLWVQNRELRDRARAKVKKAVR